MSSSDSADAIVRIKHLQVKREGKIILDDVSAIIPKGSCTAIIGPNGAGKTSLLLTLLGQLPYRGKIETQTTARNKKIIIGYVPQRIHFDPRLCLTVLEFMVMGWQRWPLWFGVQKKYRDKAIDFLAAVDAESLIQKNIGVLSGGEIQRILLALALSQEPELIILDEFSAGVDTKGEIIFCECLDRMRQSHGFTQIMVSHDLATVVHHATHVICLNKKIIAEGVPKDILNEENLHRIFGTHLGIVDTSNLPKIHFKSSSKALYS